MVFFFLILSSHNKRVDNLIDVMSIDDVHETLYYNQEVPDDSFPVKNIDPVRAF